jgi:hypothetical protein
VCTSFAYRDKSCRCLCAFFVRHFTCGSGQTILENQLWARQVKRQVMQMDPKHREEMIG